MSDLRHQTTEQEIRFKQRGDLVAYSGAFADPRGNLWRIDVIGREEPVNFFKETKPFSLTLKPLGTKTDVPDSPVRQRTFELSEKAPQLPALDVTFTLEQPVEGPPYQVSFEIDPCMTDDYDSYNFCLKGSDTKANVSYHSNGGDIQVMLSSGRRTKFGVGSFGNLQMGSLPKYSWCYISVERLSGNPCYTLSGDITVN